ncbi:hypothetical protein [Caulobacter sp. UNC279MFTsu5.1]|uniref:hypothetical protein n=1 Tax=Caulobacter sp. UNC279MFTsu5.1 TaxID=1502775 RepID=UPI00037E422E|nr:hypothetical protein [Caulobacter sp. UNC279MFTsu5.1]SFI94372.1 hypothetical protein SAMN02799626_00835 [Caulobacter sp. UNC279MFTsu5.1]
MKPALPAMLGLAFSLVAGAATATPVEVPWAKLTFLGGGWTTTTLRVQTSGAFSNPAACAMTDGYIVDSTLPGAQLLDSILLTAYSTNQDVMLVIDGCVQSRPAVIGVYIRRS